MVIAVLGLSNDGTASLVLAGILALVCIVTILVSKVTQQKELEVAEENEGKLRTAYNDFEEDEAHF